VTLRLKPSTKAGLQAMAEADRRPFATFLAMILEDHFAEAENKAQTGRKRSGTRDQP
jgi:hypothetical protein